MTASNIIKRRSAPRGFTIVEAAMCVLIVGMMFVASMHAVAASAMMQFTASDRARAGALASSLISEVLQQHYVDPGPSPLFGLEPGENNGTSRTGFNDVDDYHGYVDNPPVYRDGSSIPGVAPYRRSVSVHYVDPINHSQTSLTDTGAKRITVTVQRQDRVLARTVAIKTSAP